MSSSHESNLVQIELNSNDLNRIDAMRFRSLDFSYISNPKFKCESKQFEFVLENTFDGESILYPNCICYYFDDSFFGTGRLCFIVIRFYFKPFTF